jgi:imidazolonepropionase-like amidohydrolase
LPCAVSCFAFAREETEPSDTHSAHVTIFDGVNGETVGGNVLIEDYLIKAIGAEVATPEGATVINGGEKS